jgi:uncharacterized protein YqhQ
MFKLRIAFTYLKFILQQLLLSPPIGLEERGSTSIVTSDTRVKNEREKTQVGGQAVIEGVMMKAPGGWSVAVRSSSGDIKTKKEPLKKPKPIWRLPFIRGFVVLCQTLRLGLKALEFSASVVGGEEEKPMSKTSIALTMVVAFLFATGLFLFLPVYLTKAIGTLLKPVGEGPFLFNAVDGIIRIGLFLIYIMAVGMWKDMRRIFEYHGAEHKVIHAYEHEKRLVPEEIKKFSPSHPRCGTSFLMIVMIISILLFSFIPKDYNLLEKFLARLMLIPAVAGLSYETLKLSARYNKNIFMKTFAMPGLALQKLTAKEPDENQIEVAIVALKEALSFTHNTELLPRHHRI